ncbi:ABC transporter ATP-binding protein [uncultured Desulfosarcina sp.]|uniref:ABC transporter ATP-binding protein n=1 Tax=uncultured Desulfosarcina sp. TaxID=218289 RepID=UPI0029C632F6|nr:ABC transporter ATP-binding protein [uncultured Desulfosarcina sp.]
MKPMETLEMIDISKSFQGVRANDNINLKVSSGEILGLLGENGAGKTTLMNILYGLYQPDSGDIRINGRRVTIDSPKASLEHGIGMVHQHFMLVQNHSVIENIALGYARAPVLFPQKKIRDHILSFSQKFNFDIDPDKKIWQLSAGEQQRVEIVKALVNGARLLILDEPTSVLTPQETRDFFQILERMRAEGQLIILISHKLDEIKNLCDRVTVLRKGQVVGHADTSGLDKREMARMMIGRDVVFSFSREKMPREEKVLEVRELTVDGDKGYPVVKGVSFDVYRNEILGIAGVSGNGQREMVEAITGLRLATSGSIAVNGVDITNQSPRKIHNNGVSHVPEERIRFGIAPNLFLYENAILKQHHEKKFSRRAFLAYGRIKAHTKQLIKDFQVATPSINVQTKNLSGGNIQKLILGREIADRPDLLVASHPTYGLDVGATEYLRNQLLKRREEGGAVLLVSEDLDEIFELCDRIAVIFQGRFMGILESDDPRRADIGLMMAGTKEFEPKDEAHAARHSH